MIRTGKNRYVSTMRHGLEIRESVLDFTARWNLLLLKSESERKINKQGQSSYSAKNPDYWNVAQQKGLWIAFAWWLSGPLKANRIRFVIARAHWTEKILNWGAVKRIMDSAFRIIRWRRGKLWPFLFFRGWHTSVTSLQKVPVTPPPQTVFRLFPCARYCDEC